MTQTSISVLIPSYNCGLFLGAAVESALAQTLAPSEIIVIDDGSSDDTETVARRFGNKVRYIRQENAGVSAARNRGLELATGEFIALLDADDVAAPTRFEAQAQALRGDPEAVGCFTGHWVLNEEGQKLSEFRCRAPTHPDQTALKMDFLTAVRALTPRFPHPGTLTLRRNSSPLVRFPVGVRLGEDLLFCAILRTCGRFVFLPDPLYGYRDRTGSATRSQTQFDGTIACFEQRLRWALENRDRYCPDREPDEVRFAFWEGLAQLTENYYWLRQRELFLVLRKYLRGNWPPDWRLPQVAGWWWWPEWAWRLRLGIGALVAPLRSFAGGRSVVE